MSISQLVVEIDSRKLFIAGEDYQPTEREKVIIESKIIEIKSKSILTQVIF